MRSFSKLILWSVFALFGQTAHAAATCSAATLASVTAPIDVSDPSSYRVYLNCNLTLKPDNRVEKRLILQGAAAQGITIDCNGATIDGAVGTKNSGKDMISIVSSVDDSVSPPRFVRPSDITVRNCKINGSMRISGMGPNGEGTFVRDSSRKDGGHVSRLRAAAPTRILLDNLTITASERTR